MGGEEAVEEAHRDAVAQEELSRIISELSIDESTDADEDGDERVQKAIDTLMRIADLAREPEHRPALGSQLGIVRRVSKILASASASASDLRSQLVEQALRVVANVVADTDGNRLLLLDKTSVVKDLVRILGEFEGRPVILRNCCGALANMACDNHKVCTALQKLGGHLEVLKLVRNIVSAAPKDECASDEQRGVLSLALRALSNMCHSQVIQRDLVGKGEALPVFKMICERRDDSFTEQVITLTTDLGGDQQAAVLESGFNQFVFNLIDDLLNDLESEGDNFDEEKVGLLEAALRFVCKSFQYTSPRNAALPDMVLPLFRVFSINALANSQAYANVVTTALDALIQLTSDKSLHERLLKLPDAKFLEPLVETIRQVNNLQVTMRAVMVLSNICISEAQCVALVRLPSLIEVLCKLVQASLSILPNVKLRVNGLAMGVLRAMSIPVQNKRELLTRGMLPAIFSVFTSRIDPRQSDPRLIGHVMLQSVVALRHLTTKCAENLADAATFSMAVPSSAEGTSTAGESSSAADDAGAEEKQESATADAEEQKQTFIEVLSSVSTQADGNTPLDFEIGRLLATWTSNDVSARDIASSSKCVQLITTLLTSEHQILHREGTNALHNLCAKSPDNASKLVAADSSLLDALFKVLLRSSHDVELLSDVLKLVDTMLRAIDTDALPAPKRKELFDANSEAFHELISTLNKNETDGASNDETDGASKDEVNGESKAHGVAQRLEEFEKAHFG